MIEGIQAYTNEKSERILEKVILFKIFSNSPYAMKVYRERYRKDPQNELCAQHMNYKELCIIEKKYVRVR